MVFVPNSFILVFTECTIKSISQVFVGICLSDYVVLDPFLSGIFIRMLIFTRSTCIGSLCEINPLYRWHPDCTSATVFRQVVNLWDPVLGPSRDKFLGFCVVREVSWHLRFQLFCPRPPGVDVASPSFVNTLKN